MKHTTAFYQENHGLKFKRGSLIQFTLPNQLNLKHSALSVLSSRETITNHSPIICSFSSLSPASDKHPLTTISIKTPFRKQGCDDKENSAILLTDYEILLYDCTLAPTEHTKKAFEYMSEALN